MMHKFSVFIVIVLIFISLSCGVEETSLKENVVKEEYKKKLLNGGIAAFREASEGIKTKLADLKREVSLYYDQSGTAYFLKNISDLQKSMNNLQSNILKAPIKDNVDKIIEIDQTYLRLSVEWQKYKNSRITTTTETSVNPIKLRLIKLSNELNIMQLDILQHPSSSSEKEIYLNNLKNIQSLIATLMHNLPLLDSYKAKRKAHQIQHAINHLKENWKIYTENAETANPIVTFPTPTTFDPSREELHRTIQTLLAQLTDLKDKISSSSVDTNKKNAYILAITGTEKLLNLLESVLNKAELDLLFNAIMGTKDSIQEIVLLWNSASSSIGTSPVLTTTTTTTTQSSTTLLPQTTMSPDQLNILKDQADAIEIAILKSMIDLLNFPGEKVLVGQLQKQNIVLQTNLSQVRNNLETNSLASSQQQLSSIQNALDNLKTEFAKIKSFFESSTTTVAPTVPPAVATKLSNTINDWQVALLFQKVDLLSFPGDKTLTADLLMKNLEITALMNSYAQKIPAITPEEVTSAIKDIQEIKQNFEEAKAEYQATSTTVLPFVAEKLSEILDNLYDGLQQMKSEISAFPVNQNMFSGILVRNEDLLVQIYSLKQGLPGVSLAQVNSATEIFEDLKKDFDTIMRQNQMTTTTTTTASTTLTSITIPSASTFSSS